MTAAIIVPAKIEPLSPAIQIQDPVGGVATALFAAEGAHVSKGDTLVEFDHTHILDARAALADQIFDLRIQIDRLAAIQNGANNLTFSVQPTTSAQATAQALQKDLFDSDLEDRRHQAEQLRLQAEYIQAQQSQLSEQRAALQIQLALIVQDQADQRELDSKGLGVVRKQRDLEMRHAQIIAQQARVQAEQDAAEVRQEQIALEMAQLEMAPRHAALRELATLYHRLSELRIRDDSLRAELSDRTITAPVSGTIQHLTLQNVGEVVQPGQIILTVARDDDPLILRAKLPARYGDQVSAGQTARVDFGAPSAIPTYATVTQISSTARSDGPGHPPYYTLELSPRRTTTNALRAGRPATVYIEGPSQSVLAYFLASSARFFAHAFPSQ